MRHGLSTGKNEIFVRLWTEVPFEKTDINKAVQGDSGQAQATMVTEQYSYILDEGRQANAQLIARGAEQDE